MLHRKRPRDLVRRKKSPKGRNGLLVWLEDADILTVEGDSVTLTDNWLEALDEQRQIGGEIEAEELARKRYRAKSRAYHRRHEAPKSEPSAAGLEAVKRSHEQRQAGLAAIKERAAAAAKAEEMRKAGAFVRNRLRELGRIRLALLQVEALGCRVEELPEFDNRRFVFPPLEGAA